ncbi:MAG: hypothetical protein M1831_002305 [Alyxoria varia]|nr:MAG: hypothetical protein M1831_002305 [Alyxoria varia]
MDIHHQVKEEHSPPPDDAFFLPALGHAVAGATGTAFSNVFTYPLSLIVTRLQVQQRSAPHSPKSSNDKAIDADVGVVDTVRKIYQDEGGLSAFYNGVSQDTLKSVIDSFLFFLVYNTLRKLRKPTQSTLSTLVVSRLVDEIGVGVLAGAAAKGVTSPLQQIITFKQTNPTSSKASVRDISVDIYRKRGISGFWAGYSASLILTLNPSLTMFVDSFARKTISKRLSIGPVWTFFVAASSKALASSTTYPLSLAKSRAQVAWSPPSSYRPTQGRRKPSGNVLTSLILIAQHEGILSLYSGLSAEVFKGFLSHGLTMLIKQRVHSLVIWVYFKLIEMLRLRRLHRISKE